MDLILENSGELVVDIDVMLAQKGNKDAFIGVVERYKVSLYTVARSILNNQQDVEDALQEMIIKAWKGIKGLRDTEAVKGWLIRILVNECNKLYKKKKKYVLMENLQEYDTSLADSYANVDLERAISMLEYDLRLIVILYYFEDMTINEISEIVNKPAGTVKSRLFRAREKLYDNLKEG